MVDVQANELNYTQSEGSRKKDDVSQSNAEVLESDVEYNGEIAIKTGRDKGKKVLEWDSENDDEPLRLVLDERTKKGIAVSRVQKMKTQEGKTVTVREMEPEDGYYPARLGNDDLNRALFPEGRLLYNKKIAFSNKKALFRSALTYSAMAGCSVAVHVQHMKRSTGMSSLVLGFRFINFDRIKYNRFVLLICAGRNHYNFGKLRIATLSIGQMSHTKPP